MLTVSEAAVKYLSGIVSSQIKGTKIRVFVEHPGTEDADCGVALCPPNLYDAADINVSFPGLDIVVDPVSAPFLEIAVICYKYETLTLKAPEIKLDMLAKDRPIADRVKFVIMTKINPSLALHGGSVELEGVNDGTVSVRFHGGCVGCASVNITLSESLQRQMNLYFPEEKLKVVDVTEHVETESSYHGPELGAD